MGLGPTSYSFIPKGGICTALGIRQAVSHQTLSMHTRFFGPTSDHFTPKVEYVRRLGYVRSFHTKCCACTPLGMASARLLHTKRWVRTALRIREIVLHQKVPCAQDCFTPKVAKYGKIVSYQILRVRKIVSHKSCVYVRLFPPNVAYTQNCFTLKKVACT